ncbi:hypothetical protein Pfo_016723 [Paulownia fortunei]|nr:hypothetical protein Pfo_016723 [Paulownia fortunei]
MLLGENLGFLCSVVVVVVGWLVARRKWRRVAARREEIKRLMALASEEAARAELEAASGYISYGSALAPEPVAEEPVIGSGSSPGRQFQYQCEVCFSPTTTRCKQCKAVHYCSRKCQIFHWRQGHKDECRSVTTHQNIDVGVHSCLKEFKQDDIRSSRNVNGIQVTHTTKPVESSSGERMFLNPILHVLGENNDTETETSDDWKKTDINVKASVHSLPDECSSSTVSIDMPVASDSNLKDGNRYDGQSTFMNKESMKPLLSEEPGLTKPEYALAASSVSNQLKSGCIDTGEKSESSTSSGCSAASSEGHSLSEPSTPSSDFWGETVEPIRSKINARDGFGDVNMSNSRSSNVHVELLGSDMNRVLADDPCPATSMPRKSIALSEVSEDGLKSRGPLFLSCKLPGQYDVSNTFTECKEEAKLSSNACQELKSEGNIPSEHVDVSSSQSLAPKQVDHEIDGTNGILDTLKSQRNDSSRLRSSEAHLSSSACTRKPAILDAQSVENECTHWDASCSLESGGYVRSATSGPNPSARRVADQLRASNFVRHGSLGAGIVGRYEGSFSYELFVKLYNWNKVELCPCGLKNCGNSCYANAVLQCLAFTPPLTAYFLQGLHAKTCHKKEWCFTCEFEALVKKAKEGNYPLSPARIMSQMQRVATHLGNGREEDAHEFLRYAIDAMQFVCLKEAGVNVLSSLEEETTLLGLTFGGYLQSKIECMRCGGKSKQHERIMDLTVEIGGEIGTLEDALRQFTRSEILDGENKYHCGRCKSYEKAKKKLRVLEAPNVLTIALKRFQSGKFGKLNKAVKFPEILNLAPYMSGTSDKSPIYQLYGVVVHLDVKNATFSGHYVCCIKNNQGRWFKADDSMVQVVELKNVLWNNAYMLFYARCSPRAPKLIRNLMVPREPRKVKTPTSKFKSHPAEPWDVSVDGLSGHTSNGDLYRKYMSDHPTRSNLEEEWSEYSSSFFSESGSYSTESSNRESISTDDIFDDMGNCWNRPSRSTSDSDPPSPSPTLSPLRTRQSSLADLDRHTSDAESSSSCSVNISSNMDGDGKVDVSAGKGSDTFLCSSTKDYRIGSSSCRENDSNILGSNNSCDNVKGVYLRRSMS